jgi:hypothetical protein
MVGLKTPINAQSNITVLTILNNIPSLVVLAQTLHHLASLGFFFLVEGFLKENAIMQVSLCCCPHLSNLTLYAMQNTSPVTLQSNLV